MLPAAVPVVQAIARVTDGGVTRLVFRLGPPPLRVDFDDDDEDDTPPSPAPKIEAPRDWLSVAARPTRRGSFGVPVATIIAATAAFYDVAVGDILARRRSVGVVRPRQVAMYLTKVLTTRSYPDIGRRFGGRDHTTILHGVRKITGLLTTNAALAADVSALLGALSAVKPAEGETPEAGR
nr:helix-turn-helix domain-containing protein [Starkeya sp. ORNL1]